ncbi:autotransporter outer membrane beta-barrel domain-containing protein [Citrobacter freundii]|nr:autotransporter outer membrane beta-barrel domain-containing protein [Citrobacter freundii]WFW11176.1 autotransporter outer membrane beta-barrel domain-containing protein [Citrobacter freundii]
MLHCKMNPLSLLIASALAFAPLAQATEIMAGEKIDVNDGELVEDVSVNKKGTLNILSGGKSQGTQINFYGTENVLSGGISENASVHESGTQNVSGIANNTQVSSGGIQYVDDGGIANNTTVGGGNSGVYGAQYVERGGNTTGTVVIALGSQYVKDGGYTSGTVINGGFQNVLGGIAENSQLIDGQLTVEGGVANNTVQTGGAIAIREGGTANNTISHEGTIRVEGTNNNNQLFGTAYETIVNGGVSEGSVLNDHATQVVTSKSVTNNATLIGETSKQSVMLDGLAVGTTLKNGTQNVYGTARQTTIWGGTQNIEVNGIAQGTTLETESASQVVKSNGTASNTTINGGLQIVQFGGTAKNTTLNMGAQAVRAGAVVTDTTINGGESYVAGVAMRTEITDGLMQIYTGGIAMDADVKGGLLSLDSGAQAAGKTQVGNAGQMLMQAGAKATDISLNKGTLSIGTLSEEATLTSVQVDSLTMKDGTVAFQLGETARYTELKIGELTGTGHFLLNTSLADSAANFVTIERGNGSFSIAVADSGKEIADHTDLTVNLVNDKGGDIDFTLQSSRGDSTRAVDGGTYMYVLKQEAGKDAMAGNVWYLGAMTDENGGGNGGDGGDGGNGGDGNTGGNGGDGNTGGNGGGNLAVTPSTDAVLSLANAGLNIMRGEMDGLRTYRHGRSQSVSHGEGSVWGHYLGKKSATETSNGAAYKLYQNGMEFGSDVVSVFGNGRLVTGGVVSLTSNNVKHARGGTSTVDSYGLGAYGTWYDNSGFYLDGVMKANRLESKLNARMTNGGTTSGEWHQYGLSSALEAGYTFMSMASVRVEPFMRMTGTYINDANVTLNNGMKANTGKARSLTAEAGSRFGTDFSAGHTAFRPYLSISVEQELAHSNEAVINQGNSFKNNQDGTSGKYAAGMTVSPAKDVTLYGEFNYRQGRYIEEPIQGVAGISISF